MEKKDKPYKLDMVSIRMVKDAALYSDTPWDSPKKVVEALGKKLGEMDREVVCVINMTTKSKPINCSIVSVGVLDGCMVNPREVLKTGILSNASGIILLHNHPSGDVTPSENDILLTKRMCVAGDFVGINVLDHIIVGVGGEEYFSFLEKGVLPKPSHDREQDEVLSRAAERQGR